MPAWEFLMLSPARIGKTVWCTPGFYVSGRSWHWWHWWHCYQEEGKYPCNCCLIVGYLFLSWWETVFVLTMSSKGLLYVKGTSRFLNICIEPTDMPSHVQFVGGYNKFRFLTDKYEDIWTKLLGYTEVFRSTKSNI